MKWVRRSAQGLCAVLFVAIVSLWVRSYFASDRVAWQETWSPTPAAAATPIRLSRIAHTSTGRVVSYRQSPFT